MDAIRADTLKEKDLQQRVSTLTGRMTLDEKALIVTGLGWWQTHPIERLGIPSIYMCDGPHGLRKSLEPGLGKAEAATCFPTASALAASWDVELSREVGSALGDECQAKDVQILLGPGINMKRSPLGGRNFEYFSEDPVLAGSLAASYIAGVQGQGVAVCLKHFAANSQEYERMVSSSDLDERTLHEIYLRAFEIAVRDGRPWTIMTAYNPINGVGATENRLLLQDILRDQWGFSGCVISDWGAVNDRVASLLAGTNLEMPGSGGYNKEKIIAAVKSGSLPVARLDEMIWQLLAVILKTKERHVKGSEFHAAAHHELARRASADSIVLLKNEDEVLPLDSPKNMSRYRKIALIGEFAKTPRYEGAGSSQVKPTTISTAFDAFTSIGLAVELSYAPGYERNGETNDQLLAEAKAAAAPADLALVLVGLPADCESEAFDRASMSMPEGHNRLIAAISEICSNVVVVLMTGSAIEMPWEKHVKGIVLAGLGGQAGGSAIVDVLTGAVNPSAKLAETFPVRLEDTPTYPYYPGRDGHVHYGEGVFIGYRHYEKKKIQPLYPFGFGLSYTTFAYSAMKVSAHGLKEGEELTVEVSVKNSGERFGKEVVQVYVRELNPLVPRPEKELKAFAKVALGPGEEKVVRIQLDSRAFAYYESLTSVWRVNSGHFEIIIGSSSQQIHCRSTVQVIGLPTIPALTRDSLIKHFEHHPSGRKFYPRLVQATNLSLIKDPDRDGNQDWSDKKRSNLCVWTFVDNLPVFKLPALSAGKFTEQMLSDILDQVQ